MNAPNQLQIEHWNGPVGEKWVTMQRHLDAMLEHVTIALQSRVGSVSGLRVLDIGCGTGETCLLWLQEGAEVTGVDVSKPMLATAALRTAGKVTLVEADASTWTGDAPFDLAVSRFGVMFFVDPEAAFANIATNLRRGGRLVFACWRPAAENQWATVSMDALRDLLPDSPTPPPETPGPYALSDKARLGGILQRAGFAQVAIDAFDFPLHLARKGGAEEATRMATQFGPAGAALAGASDEQRAAACQRLKPVLAAFEKGGAVTLGAAAWVVAAVRSG